MPRFFRSLFVFVVLSLLSANSFAAITVTAATGGTGISADKASGSVAPAYTALTNIVLSSNLAADFATGTGLTFTLNAPANWQFQASVGTAVGAGNITVTNIVVSAGTIQITYNNPSGNASNRITISGLMVQATVKTTLSSANIVKASGGASISGLTTTTNLGSLSAVAGAFVKMQILLPGETLAAGTASGKTGTPTTQSSGTAFNVTVSAVDANWNRVTTITDAVSISTTDANGTTPANNNLASGTRATFSVTLRTLGSTATITATNVTDGTKTANTSTAVPVAIGAFSKLQILLPGETAAAGTVSGKTGTPNLFVVGTAGTAFNVTVNAVDAGWNIITSVTDVVGITSSDVNAALPANTALTAGTATLSFTFKTAHATTARTITASHINTPAKTANTSPGVLVSAGAFVKLQLLVAGEVAAAGTATGKTAATPTALSAGVQTTVTVNAVDANWNRVTSITDTVSITTNDVNAVLPAKAALVAGTKTFKVTFRTVTTTATMTAKDVVDISKTDCTSPNIVVNGGTFTKLLVLLPGETFAPGTATGKGGAALAQTAGAQFTVTVYAVDAAFNLVNTATDEIAISTTDVNNILPANANLIAGMQTFNITLKTAATTSTTMKTIKATDVTNAAKTAYTTPKITVNPGTYTKLLIILAGETFAGGTSTGKTAATPSNIAAGAASNTIKVYAVDANNNKVPTAPADSISLALTDPTATVPAKKAFVNGALTFSVTFKTLGTQTVTASDFTDGTKTPNTSAQFTVVGGSFAKLLLLMPGETHAPGSATGRSGAPSDRTAGTPFNVTVYAVDGAWNIVNTVTDVVKIASTDSYAALPANTALVNGTATLSVTFKTAGGTKTLTASDVTQTNKTANTCPATNIIAGAYSKLLILLPGESSRPGSPTGKSGTANTGARNVPFNIVVNAVDDNYNFINTINNTVTITSSDVDATLPAPAALSAGTATFTGVNIRDTVITPLPTLTATDASKTGTVDVPLGTTPTATTDYFRTQQSGDWGDVTTWESSTNGIAFWQDATRTPTSAANVITVRNNHVVTVAASVTVDQVVVEADGEIDINSGVTLTLSAAGGGIALDVNGLINNSGAITATGSLAFEAASKYQHNHASTLGTIPTATWDETSTCEVIGYTSAAGTIGGANQTFGNFIWNSPNQTSNMSLGGTSNMYNFSVLSTGSGTLQLGSTGGTLTVRNEFDLDAGTITINNTSGTQNFDILGDFTMSGGTLQKGSGTANVRFAGTAIQNFNKTAGTIGGAIGFNVNTNAIVNFGESVLDGSAATFTLATGGTILTDNDLGFTASGANGAIQVGGTRTYSTGANYSFTGTSAQVAGNGMPTTVNNLTINNTAGVTMPAGTTNYTVNGTLSLANGDLDMGTNRLLAGGSFTNSGTGTLITQNTSATPIPSGLTWTVGVEYAGTAGQTIVQGTYSNLSFSDNGTKTAASGTFNISGNWVSEDGKVDMVTNNPTVTFNGTAQNLDDDGSDSGNGIVFKNVTMGTSGVKTLRSGSFAISSQGLLTMSGTATLAANGRLTIQSDATGSGNVGPLSGNNIITGDVTVQRFITGGGNLTYRGYRLISSPISASSAANTFYDFAHLKGSGTYLTGEGGAGKGFDVDGNPTLFLYREDKVPVLSFAAGNFRAVKAINNSPTYSLTTIDGDFNMPVGNGFLFFFRGNNGTSTTTPPNDVVLKSLGVLNQGQIVFKNWFNYGSPTLAYSTGSDSTSAQGFNLAGNPYPSTIDWNTAYNGTMSTGIYAPNTDQTIYIYNATSKNYATYLNTSATTGIGTNGGSRYIPSGQGFFVHATSAGAQLVFNESAKVNAQTGALLLNTAAPTVNREIRLILAKDSISKDENVFIFNNIAHSAYVKNEDALYLKGTGAVSLSNLSADSKNLAINQLPFPKKTQTIPLNIAVTTAGNYQFNLTQVKNIPAIFNVWLKDLYQNDSIDIKHNTSYAFAVSGDAATTGANRFQLVIKPNPALAARLLNFTAVKDINKVKISWTAENEADYTQYVLERSIDGGKTFITLDSLTSIGLGTYDDLDPRPVKGENQYRLKQTDIMGNVSYSAIITVMYAEPNDHAIANNLINLYPNPATSVLNLALGKAAKATAGATYKITIVSNNGTTVQTTTSAQPTWQGDIRALLPGTYVIQVVNLKDNSIVGRSSFIKL